MSNDNIAALTQQLTDLIRAQVMSDMRHTAAPSAVMPRLLTAAQAGEYIGRSEQAIRHLIHQRELPVVRSGRNVRIDRKDLDRWIENHRC